MPPPLLSPATPTQWVSASAAERLSGGAIERHRFPELAAAGLVRMVHVPGGRPRFAASDVADLINGFSTTRGAPCASVETPSPDHSSGE
jgi:hypothetical protein